ncbi:MAG: hypothetical protein QG597_1864 [Actinomycetota bacterium]|nr:hypothetical protein [Actinomycetota bacterium]
MPTSTTVTEDDNDAGRPTPAPHSHEQAGRSALLMALARASSPDERLTQSWLLPTESDLGRQRFERWLTAVADGDAARGEEVLAARGLNAEQWQLALGEVRPVDTEAGTLPDWGRAALELYRLLAQAKHAADQPWPPLREVTGPELPEWVDPDQPWQFFPGFQAWLAEAAEAVEVWREQARAPISPAAARQLTLSLARRLLPVAGPHLMAEVQRRARAGEAGLFTQDSAGDWLELWRRLPVMARLMGTVWRQWHTVTAEIVQRIGTDLPDLAQGAEVQSIATGAGDQHADGRGVAAVRLADGTRWFLKPRSAGPLPVVAAMYAAVDADTQFGLVLPETHAHRDHTWVREVLPVECPDPAAYFTRAGAALRVLQALGATDLHHENFIAAADQPVLVDLETAIGPGGGWRGAATATAPGVGVAEVLANTPTATSMVTSPVDGPAGTASVDIGAMAGPSQRSTPYDVSSLVMTDQGPRLRRQRLPLATGSALPTVAGARIPVADHTAEVIAGYLAAGERLAALPNPTALIKRATDADVRFVVRPTQVYVRLGQQGLTAAALADGVDRELVLERLWRAFGTCPTALIEAEQVSLRELDVPLFTVPVDGTDVLTDRGGRIPSALAGSPADEALRRLEMLRAAGADATDNGADDLRAALFAAVAMTDPVRSVRVPAPAQGSGTRPPASLGPAPRPAPDGPAPLPPPDPTDTLLRLAHHRDNDAVAWLGLDYDPARHRWHHERLGPGLLGEAGIGLALVAADALRHAPATTDDPAPAGAREVGIRTLLTCAERLPRLRLGWSGADAFTGPAGTLYALARAATLVDDTRLAEAAEGIIETVLAAAAHDPAGPTVDPVAGALLALAWLPPSLTRDDAVDRMVDALTTAPNRPGRDDAIDDPWAYSLPSVTGGRLMAAHRWGLESTVQHLLPAVRAVAAEDWRPVDAAVLCIVGEPLPLAEWPQRWLLRADTSTRLLDCAHLAATHARTTCDPAWTAAFETSWDLLRAPSRGNGRWFSDMLAPDSRNLSVAHGLAAITLLGVATSPAAPDARTFG